MGNVIQIKRGTRQPQIGDLAPYELGYSTDGKILYIYDLKANEIVPLTAEGGLSGVAKDGISP
jgi:hypothetical protein